MNQLQFAHGEALYAAKQARYDIRNGFDLPTAGLAAGLTQVNMISVPKAWAYDFYCIASAIHKAALYLM